MISEGFEPTMFRALMSKAVPDNAPGELQGGIASIMNVAMLAGTVGFSQLFGYFMQPTAPIVSPDVGFFFAGAGLLVAFVLFLSTSRKSATSGDGADTDATPSVEA